MNKLEWRDDGVIVDHPKNLEWKTFNSWPMCWSDTVQFAKGESKDGWRLPTIRDLMGLCSSLPENQRVGSFWATLEWGHDRSYAVDFAQGCEIHYDHTMDSKRHVRLVREVRLAPDTSPVTTLSFRQQLALALLPKLHPFNSKVLWRMVDEVIANEVLK
jgi:hypothetical protein